MALIDTSPFTSAFPADDEAEKARWLANLITAVRSQADRQRYPEVAAALDDALAEAQAIADDSRPC